MGRHQDEAVHVYQWITNFIITHTVVVRYIRTLHILYNHSESLFGTYEHKLYRSKLFFQYYGYEWKSCICVLCVVRGLSVFDTNVHIYVVVFLELDVSECRYIHVRCLCVFEVSRCGYNIYSGPCVFEVSGCTQYTCQRSFCSSMSVGVPMDIYQRLSVIRCQSV